MVRVCLTLPFFKGGFLKKFFDKNVGVAELVDAMYGMVSYKCHIERRVAISRSMSQSRVHDICKCIWRSGSNPDTNTTRISKDRSRLAYVFEYRCKG